MVLDEVFSDSVPGILNTKICYLESIVNGMPYQQTRLASPPFQRRADPGRGRRLLDWAGA